jgi:hypothetical protein
VVYLLQDFLQKLRAHFSSLACFRSLLQVAGVVLLSQLRGAVDTDVWPILVNFCAVLCTWVPTLRLGCLSAPDSSPIAAKYCGNRMVPLSWPADAGNLQKLNSFVISYFLSSSSKKEICNFLFERCPIYICKFADHSDPRGLRHERFSLARKLRSWVRIPLKAWMSLCVYSLFVLGSGFATG